MDPVDVILKFITDQGVSVGIVLFGMWFLTTKVWPWWVIADARRAETMNRELKVLTEIGIALSQISTAVAQIHTTVMATQASLNEHRAAMQKPVASIDQMASDMRTMNERGAAILPKTAGY